MAHGNKFLNPARDGAVLPILHLNGYKIANPCFLARIPRDELQKLFEGYGYLPHFVEGHEPDKMHRLMAAALDTAAAEIKRIWKEARTRGYRNRPAWPMIILRTPKGWTCPAEIDGKKCEGYWRAHQVPMGDMEKVDPRTPPLLQLEVERPSSMPRPVAKAIKIVKIRF